MIHFFIVFNKQNNVRLVKWYKAYSPAEKEAIKNDLQQLLKNKKNQDTNVLEYRNHKIVFRPYAALFMCMCVDPTDNEFAVLETIHLFVEIMDRYFGKVRELDLLLKFYRVYAILDEFIVAGEVGDCNKDAIADRIKRLDAMP